MRPLLLALLLAASACAPRVRVQVPAAPAVAVDLSAVAVLTEDRACQPVADGLIDALRRGEAARVDPRAAVRVVVHTCGDAMHRTVDVDLHGEHERRRLTVEGHGHAVATVLGGGAPSSTLVAAAHAARESGWGEGRVPALSRSVRRSVASGLADDLAAQLSPLPQMAARRLHPGAATDSHRGLAHRAVLAELGGDLVEAHRLAALAHARRPTPRAAAYMAELEARLRREPGHLPR